MFGRLFETVTAEKSDKTAVSGFYDVTGNTTYQIVAEYALDPNFEYLKHSKYVVYDCILKTNSNWVKLDDLSIFHAL